MDYPITDYGAIVSDALQTDAIQKAIDACFLAGGGRVVVPAGAFRTGCIRLRSNVTLYLESGAILEGSWDPEDYCGYLQDTLEPLDPASTSHLKRSVDPFSRWNNGMIKAVNAKNIAIIGQPGSYLDGVNCFDPVGEENYRGPHMINIQNCENIYLEGYTIRRSANWAHAIFCSRNITCRNVTVFGGHDGFDVRTCDHVLVEKCHIYSGDDCIAGFDNQDVTVRDCDLESSCSVFRFGGTDVLIERCNSRAPARFGFRGHLTPEEKKAGIETTAACRHRTHTPFLYYCDFRAEIRKAPGNILVRNCEFVGPDALFQMFFGDHIWCCNRPLTQIKFQNCRITDVCEPAVIHGSAEEPITFELETVEISAREGYEDIPFMDLRDYELISMKAVALRNFRNPKIIARTQGEIRSDLDLPVDTSGNFEERQGH